MSTDAFSAEHTSLFFKPLLHWFFPSMTAAQFKIAHFYIRKSAHCFEYFVFCLFLYRGVRGRLTGWRWSWALSAFFIAAGYSALDEIHQAFVASRGASPDDSLLDSCAALFAVLILYLFFRSRRDKTPHASPGPDTSAARQQF
jgi:VanZ family protein